jgi:hypothetical protein
MRSDPFCSTLTRSEHGTITFLLQQFFAKDHDQGQWLG